MKPERDPPLDLDQLTGDEWDVAIRLSASDAQLALATGGQCSMIDAKLGFGNWLIVGHRTLIDGSYILLLLRYGKLKVTPTDLQ